MGGSFRIGEVGTPGQLLYWSQISSIPVGRAATAEAMSGKRAVKSLPLRVMSRTPVEFRRARMRKPSCLISWSQPGSEGGAFAGDGTRAFIVIVGDFPCFTQH